MKNKNAQFKDKDAQAVIGWVLRAGVLISVSIIALGGAIYLHGQGQSYADYHKFKVNPVSLLDIFYDAYRLKGKAIIQIGIALLIGTPIVRVAISVLGFVIERDYMYTVITALVLLIIISSMVSSHVG